MKRSIIIILAIVMVLMIVLVGCEDKEKKKGATVVRAPIITSRGSVQLPPKHDSNDNPYNDGEQPIQTAVPIPTVGDFDPSSTPVITEDPTGGAGANATAKPIVSTTSPASTPVPTPRVSNGVVITPAPKPTNTPVPSPSQNTTPGHTSIRSFLAYVPQLPVTTKLEKEDDNGVTLSYKVDSDNTYEQVINAFTNGGFTVARSRMKKSDGTLVYTAKNSLGIMLRIESGTTNATIAVYYDEAHLG